MPLHSIISDSGLASLAMLVLNPRRRVTTDQDPVGELPEPAERNSQPADS
jgi:hypothetical protein